MTPTEETQADALPFILRFQTPVTPAQIQPLGVVAFSEETQGLSPMTKDEIRKKYPHISQDELDKISSLDATGTGSITIKFASYTKVEDLRFVAGEDGVARLGPHKPDEDLSIKVDKVDL